MIKQARAGKAVDINALPPPVLTATAVKPSVSDSSQQAQTVPVKEELASTNKPAKPPGEGNLLGNVQTNPKESFFVWLIVGRFKRCYIEPKLLFYVHCFDVL